MMTELITAGILRTCAAALPDTAPVLLEDHYGVKYELVRAFAVGTSTDDPGLVLEIRLVKFRSVT